ncbi:MAG: hypothetical protein WCD53_11565 [Microcoleus sp.]
MQSKSTVASYSKYYQEASATLSYRTYAPIARNQGLRLLSRNCCGQKILVGAGLFHLSAI